MILSSTGKRDVERKVTEKEQLHSEPHRVTGSEPAWSTRQPYLSQAPTNMLW